MESTVIPAVLSRREKLCYGFGDLACTLYWQTFMAYLTFYYTDVFGLTALATATLLGVSRGLDAVFDPIFGVLSDRTTTRWGKFRPYLLWLAVPLAIAGVLTFSAPDWSPPAKLVWAWVTFNVLMLLYSAVNIPYTALLAVMTQNPHERTALSSIRFVFAFAGGTLVSAMLLPLSSTLGAGDGRLGFQRVFAVFGVAAVLFLWITFLNSSERLSTKPQVAAPVLRDVRDLFRNRPWLLLVAVTLIFTVYVAVRGSVTVHYFKYFVGKQQLSLPSFLPWIGGDRVWSLEGLVAAFHTCEKGAALLGVLLLPWLSATLGRKRTFVILLVLMLSSAAAFYFLSPHQVALMFGLNTLSALTGGPLGALLWSMYADTVDYSEWQTGRRSTGLVFSALIFISKQAWAIGSAVSLALMSSFGFVANTAQTPESLHALVLLMSLIPTGIGAFCLLPLFFYPLDEAKVNAIGLELRARNA